MKKLLVIPIVIVLLIAFIFVVILLLGGKPFDVDREGDVIKTSTDADELMNTSPFLSFLDGNIESCEWHFQVSHRSGSIFFRTYDYCYSGKVKIKDDRFYSVTANHAWDLYDYEKDCGQSEGDFFKRPLFDVSMIRDDLKSKQLFVCDDVEFTDKGRYYSFLDEENKTLYFYWHAL